MCVAHGTVRVEVSVRDAGMGQGRRAALGVVSVVIERTHRCIAKRFVIYRHAKKEARI